MPPRGPMALALLMSALACATTVRSGEAHRTVKAVVQPRPGAEPDEIDMRVHEVPVDLPSVPASDATLDDDDLVLGVVADGRAMAFPVRYLAMYEVVDGRVGSLPVAPTW